MLRFVSVLVFIAAVAAYDNKATGRSTGGGYGGSPRLATGVSSLGGAVAGAFANTNAGQVVPAAIQTQHHIEFRDVPSSGSVNPTIVEVGASSIPVTILFRSASSSLNVQQVHDGAQGSVQESSSDDEAHILKHSVTKPIIQEIREIITPFRKITQEIQPVQEEINTIISRNSGNVDGSSGFSGNVGGALGFSGKASNIVGSDAGTYSSSSGKTSSRSSSKGY